MSLTDPIVARGGFEAIQTRLRIIIRARPFDEFTDDLAQDEAALLDRAVFLTAERDVMREALDHIAYPALDFNDECPYCGTDDDSHGDHCATTQARATLARIGADLL